MLSYFSAQSCPKGTAVTLTMVILEFSTLSGTNVQILSPKRYNEHLRHFYMGAPPPPSPLPLPSTGSELRSLNFEV